MDETKHSHDVDVDVSAYKDWPSLIGVVRKVGFPVLLMRLNDASEPEGDGVLTQNDDEYRKVIDNWLGQKPKGKKLQFRIVPGQMVAAHA